MHDCAELLSRFADRGDEAAFSELVARHLDLVYSAALRQLAGDAHLAQDITQTVFADLARKAKSLPRDVVLAGWLYKAACFAAAKAVRSERRRQARELEAFAMQDNSPETTPDWDQLKPVIDAALAELNERDRDAVLLRFFQGRSLQAVGAALGVSDDAAQKRVERALEKLRGILARRGVTISAAALGTALIGGAIQSAPAGLLASVVAGSLAGLAQAAPVGLAASLAQYLATAKVQIALGAIGAASLIAPLVLQHHANEALYAENATLQSQAGSLAELNRLRAENARIAGAQVDADELRKLRAQHAALLRLRNDVNLLRQQLGAPAQPISDWAFKTNTAASPWQVGEEIRKEHWRDAGLYSPQKTMETFWWAVANGRADRIAQALAFQTNTAFTAAEYAGEELKMRARRLQNGRYRGMLLVSVSLGDESSAAIELAMMNQNVVEINGQPVDPNDPRSAMPEPHKFRLRRVGAEWKVAPEYSLAAVKYLNLLWYTGPSAAENAWPALPLEVAMEVRATMHSNSIAHSFPWMLANPVAPK